MRGQGQLKETSCPLDACACVHVDTGDDVRRHLREVTHKIHMLAFHYEFEVPRAFHPLDHRHLDLSSSPFRVHVPGAIRAGSIPSLLAPQSRFLLVLRGCLGAITFHSRSYKRGVFEVGDPAYIPIMVQLHDQSMGPGREEDEEEERVGEGGTVAGVVVACSAPFGDAVFVEELWRGEERRMSGERERADSR